MKQFSEPECKISRISCEDIMVASTGWFTHIVGFVTEDQIEDSGNVFPIDF